MLKSLWQYRHFILSSIKNELITRFARSKLGGMWIIINPLAQVAIYALIFSNIMSARRPDIDSKYGFTIYLMAGLLAWTLFSEIINRCLNLFIENSNLIKKIKFPRITLPTIVVGYNLVNNMFLFIAMLGIFLILGYQFSLNILWLLPLTFTLAAFATGVGLVIGVMNVFIRDLSQAVPIILQIWFWFTPIIYPVEIIPYTYQNLMNINPMYHFVTAYHEIIVYGRSPKIQVFLIVGAFSILMLLLSLYLFRRSNEEMVDVI